MALTTETKYIATEIPTKIDLASVNQILKNTLLLFSAQTGTVHFFNRQDKHLYLAAATGGLPENVMAVIRKIPSGKGIAGQAVATKKPVTTCNLQKSEGTTFAQPQAKATGVSGALCVPIFNGDIAVGTLGVGWTKERDISQVEIDSLINEGLKIGKHFAEA